MIKTHKYKFLFFIGVLVVVWLVWPIYGFYSHRDALPISPFGWLDIPAENPTAQDLKNPDYAGAGTNALKILSQHRENIGAPAISAAVAVRGEIVWAGASGWADIESKTPATPQTRFRIGSTSKALTATALARLVDAGFIQLDSPISQYLDDLPNPEWGVITPRQLASHMAGLLDYKRNRDWFGLYQTMALQTHYDNVRGSLNVFDGSPLLFEPGTDFLYTSFSTVLLGAVLGGAAEMSYLDVMQNQVFGPNNMTATIIAPENSGGTENIATFYKRDKQRSGKVRPWRAVDLTHRLPGGGFASTSSDLVKLGSAWLDENYIAASTREEFWTPQILANGKVNPQNYALGWRYREYEVEEVGVLRNANHGGVSRGAQSWLLVFPDYEMAVAFNINSKTDEFVEFGILYKDLAREFVQVYSAANE
ncbi:MAG: beta-lactamase family protein [Gammaproteobacteria bacterium]|nr:beta-lactamase family protein [Gammaproteobacteria bacterium]